VHRTSNDLPLTDNQSLGTLAIAIMSTAVWVYVTKFAELALQVCVPNRSRLCDACSRGYTRFVWFQKTHSQARLQLHEASMVDVIPQQGPTQIRDARNTAQTSAA
jgi:hypothetical protein